MFKYLLPPPLRSFFGNLLYVLHEGEPGFLRLKACGIREALSSVFVKGDFRNRSYYPDEPLKSRARIALEQFYYGVKYYSWFSSVTNMYFGFGLDRKGAKAKDYVFAAEGTKCIIYLNAYPYDQLQILQHKAVAKAYFRDQGIRVPEDYGSLVRRGDRWTLKKGNRKRDFQEWALEKRRHLFCKMLDGECGKGALALDTEPGEGARSWKVNGEGKTWEELRSLLNGKLLVEERIVQHPGLKELHPQSLNTIRVVTVKGEESERPIIVQRILRLGTGDNTVDNWAQGGLVVGINSSGRLMPYGYYKPMFKPAGVGRLTEHPDTHVVFAGREIPFFREIEEMALQAHEAFDYCTSVGWDISVSEDGPVLIEGNADYDLELGQVALGGGRGPIFEKYLYPVRRRWRSQRFYASLRQRLHIK